MSYRADFTSAVVFLGAQSSQATLNTTSRRSRGTQRCNTGGTMPSRSTGCVTCRIRKIKCDGGIPSCKRCSSTGRTCDGYSSLSFSRNELRAASQSSLKGPSTSSSHRSASLIPCLVSNATWRDVAERRYFQFFRHCTVAATNLTFDSRFWDRLILQACDAEPAIKHAVLAVAAFHNSINERDAPHNARHHLAYAEGQYQQALGYAKALIGNSSSQQINRVLMVCMLFIIYEGLRGNYTASQAHMDSGRAIAAQCGRADQITSYRRHFSEILEVFARLDVFAISFSDDSAPYRNTLSDMLRTAPKLRSRSFINLHEAQTSLIDHLRWILILENHIHHWKDYEEGAATASGMNWEKCDESLLNWRQCWNNLIASYAEADSLHVQIVELWYHKARAILNAGFTGAETRYDDAHDSFLHIAELGEAVSRHLLKNVSLASFSLDLGFIVPVFFCAIRCRDPRIRRRAIRVLELCPRKEGTWESTIAAAVAMRWMLLEEAGLGAIERSEQIPAANRITMVRTQVNVENSAATLRFFKSVSAGPAVLVREEILRWGGSLEWGEGRDVKI